MSDDVAFGWGMPRAPVTGVDWPGSMWQSLVSPEPQVLCWSEGWVLPAVRKGTVWPADSAGQVDQEEAMVSHVALLPLTRCLPISVTLVHCRVCHLNSGTVTTRPSVFPCPSQMDCPLERRHTEAHRKAV